MNRGKGSEFERLICKKLSMWWTNGERDDVFWRTSMSGGRATVRTKQGKATEMQHGDISAVDPIGVPLIKAVTLELKRGYGKASPFDLLDANHTATLEWCLFLKQVKAAQKAGNTPWWAVIFQRDRRSICIAFPREMWTLMRPPAVSVPRMWYRHEEDDFIIMKLEDFLVLFTPGLFKHVVKPEVV